MPEVRPFVKRCRELLRPGGLLLIRTPNAHGLLTTGPWWLSPYLFLYRHLVYPANPREHCYHFTSSVLAQLFEDMGFKVVAVDTEQTPAEWPAISGRNALIKFARHLLVPIAWKLRLPYEFTLFAERLDEFVIARG